MDSGFYRRLALTVCGLLLVRRPGAYARPSPTRCPQHGETKRRDQIRIPKNSSRRGDWGFHPATPRQSKRSTSFWIRLKNTRLGIRLPCN